MHYFAVSSKKDQFPFTTSIQCINDSSSLDFKYVRREIISGLFSAPNESSPVELSKKRRANHETRIMYGHATLALL